MNKPECICTRYCRIHSTQRATTLENGYTSAGINNAEILYSYHCQTNKDAKKLMCKIMNDLAIKRLCEKRSIMVDKLHEMPFANKDTCLGLNKDAKDIYIVLRNKKGEFLSYTDIIAILLHELVHHTYAQHNHAFKLLETRYREEYVKYARNTGTIPPWIKITYPKSLGKYILVDESNFNKSKQTKVNKNTNPNIGTEEELTNLLQNMQKITEEYRVMKNTVIFTIIFLLVLCGILLFIVIKRK